MVSDSGRCIDRIGLRARVSSERINPYAMHADDKSITSAKTDGWWKAVLDRHMEAHMKMKIYDCYFSHISRPLIDL